MFTPQYLLLSLNVGILFISLLVFVDVLIRFKSPLILKSLLLLMVSCIGLNAFGQIFEFYYYYSRILIELTIHILSISCINFIYLIYRNKHSKFVLLSCLFILLLIILIPIYYKYKFGLSIYTTNYYINPLTKLSNSVVRIIAIIYILSLCIYYLSNILEKYSQANIYFKKLRLWCLFMIGVIVVFIFVGILKFSFPNFFLFKFLGSIVLLVPLIIILYRPAFLNQMPVDISFLSIFSSETLDKITSGIFAKHFFVNLYYLKVKCTAAEFSEILGVDQVTLNNYIKINYDTSFTDLVNKYRILYFIDLVNNPESNLLTLESLAKQAGFSSRQNMAFFFKRFHGGSPSDYIKYLHSK